MNLLHRVSWFAATPIVGAAVALGTLPILTRHLDAADYGLFGLGMIIGNLVPALANPHSLSFFSARLHRGIPAGRLVGTVLAFSGAATLILVMVAAIVGMSLSTLVGLPPEALWISLAVGAATAPWSIVADYLVADGAARPYALVYISSAIASAGAAIAAANVPQTEHLALFIGALAGSVLQFAAALFIFTRIRLQMERRYFPVLRRLWLPNSVSGTLEWLNSLVERWALATFGSLAATGTVLHSQQYKNLAGAAVKVLLRSTWTISIDEARLGSFPVSRRYWHAVDVFLIVSGLAFATVGPFFVGILTNHKLTDAAFIAAGWMLVLLLHNSYRPAVLTLHARGEGHRFSKISGWGFGVNLCLTPLLVPLIGVWSPIVAGAANALTVYVLLRREVPLLRVASMTLIATGSAAIIATLAFRLSN